MAVVGGAAVSPASNSAALARVLADPTFELIPLRNVHEQAAAIPRG